MYILGSMAWARWSICAVLAAACGLLSPATHAGQSVDTDQRSSDPATESTKPKDVSTPDETESTITTAPADQPTPDQTGVGHIGERLLSPQDVLQRLHQSAGGRDGLFKYGPINLLLPAWQKAADELDEKTGIRIGFAYTLLYQDANDSLGPGDAAAGDFDFFGRWKAFSTESGFVGQLGFHAQDRHGFTDITPSELSESIGSIWKTTRAFNELSFRVDELWWDQKLPNDRVAFRIGTINSKNFFDQHRFKGQNLFFLSTPFSDSPTIAFPQRGFGLIARLSASEEFHITLGVSDANGSNRALDASTFFTEEEFFTAVDVLYTPVGEDQKQDRYSVTLWWIDERVGAGIPGGHGFSAVIEHEISTNVVPFLRYGYGTGAEIVIEHMISGGIGFIEPFGQKNDTLGIGAAWARPTDGTLRDQYGGEAFYRVQLTPVLSVTPGFQLIVNPSLNPTDDVIVLFEFRARIEF